ncbi:MFS transporter, putative metabolite:H+ symporter [Agrococcus baldri]|uniref:MFS transporter, putative metabolite:H+ symporter n=1 Tax=Agrococcus baldri TaxID=153730 RepID=A0AA94KZT7_9MICO|nr:MFS transporter, putative metabolite:H+ symporter [Agrococcus baldri]
MPALSTAGSTSIPAIEQRPLTKRQRALVGAAVVSNTVEFFDFFIVGFILSIIAEPWGLTFGESAIILLAAGLGTTLGALFWGRVADRIGRKPTFLWTVVTFSVATGLCAAVPEGAWLLLALLRVVVGFGVGGLPVVDIPLISEFVPTKIRARLAGLTVVFIPVGLFMGAQASALWGETLGWRGLLLLGLIPVLLVFPIRMIVRESPRWLIQQGRMEEARANVAWYRNMDPADVQMPPADAFRDERAGFGEVWRNHRRALIIATLGSFCFITASASVQAWGPTLLTQLLAITPAQAAQMFVLVSLASLIGRLFSSTMADIIGRKPIMILSALIGGAFVVTSALAGDTLVFGASLFYLGVLGAFLFGDGAFGVINTYTSEMFPSNVRATGLGMAYGLGALGKVFGPLLLALVSGSSNLITPAATQAAVAPAFLIMAGLLVLGAVIYAMAPETKGKSIEDLDTASMIRLSAKESGAIQRRGTTKQTATNRSN